MIDNNTLPLSVLDLAPIPQYATARDAFHYSQALAQHVDKLGYLRYWLAEHHNIPGIASAATAVLIGHIAGSTQTIRVGSGGVMLPNHAPLVIAEQFGTLESLYPGRIDLGLGRAPGSDQRTLQALRRHTAGDVDSFPQDVLELQRYFSDTPPDHGIQAVPGQGLHVPMWLLGSSLYSAQLAAQLGLPFAFAAHFAPDMLVQAIERYRQQYQPSVRWPAPYAMVCINVIAADTDAQARYLYTSTQQQVLQLVRGNITRLLPPVDDINAISTAIERSGMNRILRLSVVGDPHTVTAGLQALLRETHADELMISGQVFDQSARQYSYSLIADLQPQLRRG